MTYSVKEIFYSIQGEGGNAGRPAVFCRFSGCNLWSGREEDRAMAVCRFCDTDFVGGQKFAGAEALARAMKERWTGGSRGMFAVITGGEPLLQLDSNLIIALKVCGFEIAIETNGTVAAPLGIDWICVSPKAGARLVQTSGQELKLVYPQREARPEAFEHLPFGHFFLQPMDGPDLGLNTQLAIDYCLKNPFWRISLQTHKMMGIR